MSDDASTSVPDPKEDRLLVGNRLAATGVSPRRFIDVRDGEKGTRMRGHQQAINWLKSDDDRLSGNYGVHPGDGLIEFDVDDYDGEHDTSALDALPETFTVESPHTADDAPGHRYYVVEDDETVREVLREIAGTLNPEPTWGEIKYEGKYVVGPGSQLDGCSKAWCDECDEPDGGYYRIAEDKPIATLTADDIAEVLLTDPGLSTDQRAATDVFDRPPEDDAEEQGHGEDDEWFTEETAEDALSEIPPDVGYNEWRDVGFSLANHFGESAGGRLFRDWSRGGSSWDDDAPKHAENIISDASRYPHDVRTLINIAKRYGWDPSAAARAANAKANSGTDTDNESERESNDKDGDTWMPSELVERKGGYATVSYRDGEAEYNQITNFTIEPQSYLTHADGTTRLQLTVHPATPEESYAVTVEPTVFNEKRRFKQEIVTGRTTTFSGGEHALNLLRQYVGRQDVPSRRGTDHIGLHGDEFVLPTGVIGPNGWTDEHDTVYVEQSIGLERKVSITPRSDAVADGGTTSETEDVARTLELLPQTRDPERFLPVLSWFYSAPLQRYIRDWAGEGPILSVTGTTGAGKTAMLSVLWQLFGVDSDPMAATDTRFTLTATLGASNALPVWLDEYKPSDMSEYQRNTLHDLIRKSTRGGVEQRGNADKSTDEYRLHAPVVVSGEQRFAGPAEQRRSILTTFREDVTDPGTETARAFAELAGRSYKTEDGEIVHYDGVEFREHAVAYYRWLVSQDVEELHDSWRSAEERVRKLVGHYELTGIDSAGLTALQTVAFGIGLYRVFATDELDATVPITEEEIEDALAYVGEQYADGGRRVSHLDEFVELLSLVASDNEISEEHQYTMTYKRDTGTEIRVNMARSYPKVSQYVRTHGLDAVELLDKADYLERIKDAADDNESYITCYQLNTDPIGRAFGIHASTASDRVDGFDCDHFYGRDNDDDPHKDH